MTDISNRRPTTFLTEGRTYMILAAMVMSCFSAKIYASTASQAAPSIPYAALMPATSPSTVGTALPVRVYGNSVIPGGVRTSSELALALGRDPIVSDHFASFDVANARIVHLESVKMVYVSYRLGNNIYWTKNKVRLAQGEALLTDGTSFVRARCGNRIADNPHLMVSNMEPAAEILDTAQVMPSTAIDAAAYAPASIGQEVAIAPGVPNDLGKLTTPLQLATTASGSTIPHRDQATVVASASDRTTTPLPQKNLHPAGIVLADFPSGLSDANSPALTLLADDTATELPEPKSLALVMLALTFMAFVRTLDQRKLRKA